MSERKKKQVQLNKRIISLGLGVILFLSIVGVWVWLKPTLVIDRPQVVLRVLPDTQAASVAELSEASEVTLLEQQSGWSKVRTADHLEGWVPDWLLNDANLENDQAIGAQILIETPVYQEEDESSHVLTMVEAGSYLLIEQEAQGWLSVRLAFIEYADSNDARNAVLGYIPTRLVNLVSVEKVLAKYEADKLKDRRTYDPQAIAATRLATVPEVTIQFDNEPLLADDFSGADVITQAVRGETYAIVGDLATYEDRDFYFVEDAEGQRFYVNSDRVVVNVFSAGRMEGPLVKDLSQATIMLDPGHGGIDTGALSWDELSEEKQATMAIALEIQRALEEAGAKVLLTREDDRYLELVERTQLSNINEVDMFISLHIDSSEDSYHSGTSTYYYHQADQLLAEVVNHELTNQALENQGVIFGNYYVLRENTRPSLLLELGYMSNDYDVETIFSPEYQKSLATSVTKGLETYFTMQE